MFILQYLPNSFKTNQIKEFLLNFSKCNSKEDAYAEINNKIGCDTFNCGDIVSFSSLLNGGYGHFNPDEKIRIVVLGEHCAETNIENWSDIVETLDEAPNVTTSYIDVNDEPL